MAPSMIRAVAGISKDHDGPWPQSIRLSGEIGPTSRSLGCSFIDTKDCVSVSEVGKHASGTVRPPTTGRTGHWMAAGAVVVSMARE